MKKNQMSHRKQQLSMNPGLYSELCVSSRANWRLLEGPAGASVLLSVSVDSRNLIIQTDVSQEELLLCLWLINAPAYLAFFCPHFLERLHFLIIISFLLLSLMF